MAETLDPLSASAALLELVYRIWSAEPPSHTVKERESAHQEAIAQLRAAESWSTPRWQEERDRVYEAALTRVKEANDATAPARAKLHAQLKLATQLRDKSTGDTRTDFDQLIKWLQNELATTASCEPAPKTTAQLSKFKMMHLSHLTMQVRATAYELALTRKAWEAYEANQANAARVQAVLSELTGQTES